MMQDIAEGRTVTASNAAAVAVTFRSLQLASSAPDPVVPPGCVQQLLHSINTSTKQAAKQDQGVLAACMAEALAFQDVSGHLVRSKPHKICYSKDENCMLPGRSAVLPHSSRPCACVADNHCQARATPSLLCWDRLHCR